MGPPEKPPEPAAKKPKKSQLYARTPTYAGPPRVEGTPKTDSAQPTPSKSTLPTTAAPTASGNSPLKRTYTERDAHSSSSSAVGDASDSDTGTHRSRAELTALSKLQLVELVWQLQQDARRMAAELRAARRPGPSGAGGLRGEVEQLRAVIRDGILEQMDFPVPFGDAVWRVEGIVGRRQVWMQAFGPAQEGFEPLKRFVMGIVVKRKEGVLTVIERGFRVLWREGEGRYVIRGNYALV
ncbi:hypothetical protein BU16DRAFT_538367 [Lophium mytilinum]|uniref:Uncharacterized protein n=1 Tax=Lophium mytilinum TaxID=390894 RepID=A0A6A6R093_9PEZI|nr:hypothetical protein BU16DRAFT_538367 [Lophium mytilinum]